MQTLRVLKPRYQSHQQFLNLRHGAVLGQTKLQEHRMVAEDLQKKLANNVGDVPRAGRSCRSTRSKSSYADEGTRYTVRCLTCEHHRRKARETLSSVLICSPGAYTPQGRTKGFGRRGEATTLPSDVQDMMWASYHISVFTSRCEFVRLRSMLPAAHAFGPLVSSHWALLYVECHHHCRLPA